MSNYHIVVEEVSKFFVNKDVNSVTNALDNVSLEIKPGEFISIVGASGCGKSTLLRLITGLDKPTLGKITFNGEEVTGPSSKRGFMFQQPTLFNWMTIWDNVAFGPKMQKKYNEKKEYIQELLDLVGLSEFSQSYPSQLSGGMAQRAALARALAGEPEALFLDEPLGALDAFTRMNIQDELMNIWRKNKSTMVMVTHDVEEAIFLSTRVVVMSPRPGRISEIIPIDLPYPRNRNSEKFYNYRGLVLEKLNFIKETVITETAKIS